MCGEIYTMEPAWKGNNSMGTVSSMVLPNHCPALPSDMLATSESTISSSVTGHFDITENSIYLSAEMGGPVVTI